MTVVTIVTAAVVSVACGGASTTTSDDVASVTSVTTATPVTTVPAADLAPSQQTAETVAPPETPPPCDPSDLSVWTAQVQVHAGGADAVVRVRNDGAIWCEVDVSGSPTADPMMEPDVWLDPGAWADLIVGSAGDGCDEPVVLTQTELDLNGGVVLVPTALVAPCAAQLVAFYPNEVSEEACAELAVAVTDTDDDADDDADDDDAAIVIRNDGVRPCRLGSLVSASGDDVVVVAAPPEIATPVLAAGDVVALAVRTGGGAERPVALAFDSGVTFDVALAGPTEIVGAEPQPWIGGPGGPAALDPAVMLDQLDPFG